MTDEHDGRVPALDALSREIDPPSAARARIAGALHAQGLIHSNDAAARRGRWWLQAAAAAVIFAAGLGAGSRFGGGAAQQPSFILLVYGSPDDGTPEAERVAEYSAWARDARHQVAQADRLGEAIFHAGAALPGSPSGFFLLTAGDDEAAKAIARSHPHARAGGTLALHRLH